MKKKILLWGIVGLLFLSAGGCGKQELKGQQQGDAGSDTVQELENAKGVSSIVSIENAYYYDLFENADGNICALAYNGANGEAKDIPVIAWESSDRGESWEELLYQPDETGEHSELLAGVLRDGTEGTEAFVVFSDYSDGSEDKSPKLFRITENEQEELNAGAVFEQIGNMVWNVSLVNEHVISVAAGEQCAFYDIEKQEVLKCLPYDAYAVGFLSMPEQFVIYGEKIVYCLNAETLEEEEPEESLNQFVSSVYKKNESNGGNVFPPMDMRENRIICVTAGGIYEYRNGETVQALSVPGAVNGGNSFNGMLPVCKGKDNSYYVSAHAAGTTELQRLEADQDTGKESFTIYSLTENADIEQVATLFQQQHPELSVEVQVGIEEEASITRTDVIKQLNTELLAGEGPDVIIMDGLSVEQYIDMGLLLPIELEASEEQYFDRVLETYQQEGKLYAIPSGFWLYAVQGRSDLPAENATPGDVSQWTISYADEAGLDGYQYTYGYNSYSQYVQVLYDIYGSSMIKDGLADKEVLEEYMGICAELAEFTDSASLDENYMTSSILPGIIELHYNDKVEISAGMVLSIVELAALTTEEENNGIRYSLYPMYQPCDIIAINANTERAQTAQQFAEFALSDSAQNANKRYVFPISRNVFRSAAKGEGMDVEADKLLQEIILGEEEESFYIYCPSEKKTAETEQDIREINTVFTDDVILREIVMDAFDTYLSGTVSLEDAISSAENKINLYLGE